jgi:ATP-dependent DNA helicase RecG
VRTNLIDAYDRLHEFITKHTSDRFFIIGYQRVSVRSHIAHEIISNILAHREYSSAFTAKIIIERNQIVTENWSLPKVPGNIDPDNFTPFSKNPLIANFFMNIGYADALGSGVRNLYKFTEIYSGTVPKLIDGDVFRTIVPFYDSLEDALEESAVVGCKSEESAVQVEKVGGSDEKVGCKTEEVGCKTEEVGCKTEESAVQTEESAVQTEESAVQTEESAVQTEKSAVKSKEEILKLMSADKFIIRDEIVKRTGLSTRGVDKNIKQLKADKNGHWKVKEKE